MNNLFRINKDNVQDFLVNYKSTYKTIKNNNPEQDKKKKIIDKPNQINMFNQINMLNIKKNNIISIEPEQINYKKYNYNYDNLKKKDDEIELDHKNINNKNTFIINNSINEITKLSSINNNLNVNKKKSKSGEKILWEFGKSGIKIEKLKKSMIKNLAIFTYIHKIFVDFIDRNKSLNLSNIFEYFKNLSDNIDKPIYSNSKGNLNIFDNSIYCKLDKKKISGIYKIIDCGYAKLFDPNINEEYLRKNKIPNLDSILSYSDNIKHFSKIIKIFHNQNLFKSKSNSLGDLNWINLINEFLPTILLNIEEKKDIFNFESKKFSFYVKIYQTHTKAFVIDKNKKLIYYINTIENNSKNSGYLFFYVYELNSKYKIISYSYDDIKNKLILQKNKFDNKLVQSQNQNQNQNQSQNISSFEEISSDNDSKYKYDNSKTVSDNLSNLSNFTNLSKDNKKYL
jgi:hypothetical protein